MMRAMLTLAALALSCAAQQTRVFTGVITCTMCKNDHRKMGISPDDLCVRECIKHGAKYALFDGRNLYRLSDQQTPEKFAAQRVRVTGVLYAKTGIIKVERIEPAGPSKPGAKSSGSPRQPEGTGHKH
ncbi:MAG: DUF5818 domain-containing protein [Bryobacterales bacterium]|nr:DUF5818 domain-containing protein [Bryobacteraceae bacterium]MDW8129199.1 DUF5818 domain-containing protein [Bryobacterales bacterium]